MNNDYTTYHSQSGNLKIKKWSIKRFKIDTTHYKSNGPRIVKSFDIKF